MVDTGHRQPTRWRSRLVAAGTLVASAALLLPSAASARNAEPDIPYFQKTTGAAVNVNGTYQPIVGHFTDLLFDDIIWYAPGDAVDNRWTPCPGCESGQFTKRKLEPQIKGHYEAIVGNFAGDGLDDIYWRAQGNGNGYLWTNTGSGGFTSRVLNISLAYDSWVVLPDSRHGSGKDDILWVGRTGAKSPLWVFPDDGSGTPTTVARLRLPTGNQLKILAGDFDDNGATDLFFYDQGYDCSYTPYPGCQPPSELPDWYWRRSSGTGGTFTTSQQNIGGKYMPFVGHFSKQADATDDIFWLGFQQHGRGGNSDEADALWEGRPSGHFSKVAVSLDTVGGQTLGHDGSDTILTWPQFLPTRVWFNTTSGPVTRELGSPDPFTESSEADFVTGRFTSTDREDLLAYFPGPKHEVLYHPVF